MPVDFVEAEQFNKAIRSWSLRLNAQIQHHIFNNKKVYLIALSRKMPRFFNWLFKTMPVPEISELKHTIDSNNVNIVTEYVIPLLLADISEEERGSTEVIVVDDALIYGTTARQVLLEWIGGTGKYANLSSLFCSSEAINQDLNIFVNNDDDTSLFARGFKEIEEAFNLISARIWATSLPVDIEYPLLHIDRPYEEIKSYIQSINNLCYEVSSSMDSDIRESYSVIFETEYREGYNNDFCKIRLFPKEEGKKCLIEVIAPNAISVDDLKKHDLFVNSTYAKAWQLILTKITASTGKQFTGEIEDWIGKLGEVYFKKRGLSTLALWANYLYSLSSWGRIRSEILTSDLPSDIRLSVEAKDLTLLLGNEVTSEVINVLQTIIDSSVSSFTCHPIVTLPIYIKPESLKERYNREILENMQPENTVYDNLEAIFLVSAFTNTISFELSREERHKFGHHHFGETYESLTSYLRDYHYDDPNITIEIHSWIDRAIDENRVAPKYEIVTGSDKREYFRRFFLCGSNIKNIKKSLI